MRLSITALVFRRKEILQDLYRRIDETLSAKYEFEDLFICERCNRGSFKVMNEFYIRYSSNVEIFLLACNYGHTKQYI